MINGFIKSNEAVRKGQLFFMFDGLCFLQRVISVEELLMKTLDILARCVSSEL